MTEPTDAPVPYRVAYSGWVQDALRQLIARAEASGHAREVLAAIKEIDCLLHVYPQFGDPLIDLVQESGQLRIMTIPPLVLRYAVYEDSRLVIVTRPIETLPGSGI